MLKALSKYVVETIINEIDRVIPSRDHPTSIFLCTEYMTEDISYVPVFLLQSILTTLITYIDLSCHILLKIWWTISFQVLVFTSLQIPWWLFLHSNYFFIQITIMININKKRDGSFTKRLYILGIQSTKDIELW